ncbi:hypothetical protein KEM54_005100 [Ascosphaera aggregata]|nr:hypothetical protein KEM54_005100 [Ascosphaera aggregata]
MSGRLICDATRLDANLPVTAIAVSEVAGRRLVLHSCGPYVHLVDEKTGHVCSKLRTFKRHNVHGILATGLRSTQDASFQKLFLAWGGSSLRVLRVTIGKDGCMETAQLSSKSSEYLASDWILDAGILESQEHDAIRIALITAHNVLLSVELNDTLPDRRWHLTVHELASGLKSVLYSADIAWLSSTQILVAAGTVFGEIVTWSCFLSPPTFRKKSTVIHHFFTGHEGSIFGVDISLPVSNPNGLHSGRLLASCSDDRTIRIWDISDCSSNTSAVVQPGDIAEYSTGFGNRVSRGDVKVNPEGCICTTYGHTSRIWGVKFLKTVYIQQDLKVQLVSRGEDSTTQIWEGTLRPKSFQKEMSWGFKNDGLLSQIIKREYHSGKNVWSLAALDKNKMIDVYSGGADGSVITYPITNITSSVLLEEELLCPPSADQDDRKFSRYVFVSDVHILATSVQGDVILGTIINATQDAFDSGKSIMSWETLDTVTELKNHSVLSSDPSSGIAVLCGLDGEIFIYRHHEKALRRLAQADRRVAGVYIVSYASPVTPLAFVISYMNRDDAQLFLLPDLDQPEDCTKLSLQAPKKFVVTSAQYLQEQDCVVLGGRSGGLSVFDIGSTDIDTVISPSLSCEHFHGKDTITSVMLLPMDGDTSAKQNILTTGRDGYYSVHEISKSFTSYEVKTIHRSAPPLGINIEGAYIDAVTKDLILFGFRSTQFTIYNETSQSVISTIECGGAHRTWTFNHSTSSEGRKTFAWTRASTFHISSRIGLIQRSVRVGGHGREIKAMCASPVQLTVRGIPRRVIATGAEDTTIRLFAYTPESRNEKQGSFHCVLTLNKHTTGLQHLQFSPCGRYLFSSGGLEELYVWRIRSIPGLGLGAVLDAACPKSASKSDLRITSFDILEVKAKANASCFLLALTYSNSEMKVFMYTSLTIEAPGTFTPVAQGRYKTNCLTHVRFASYSSNTYLITASTDGHIAVWSIEDALAPFITYADGHHLEKLSQAATAQDSIIHWRSRHPIHQNSIKALEIIRPVSEPNTSRKAPYFIIVTGGDDNSLAVTSISIPSSNSEENFSTSYISESRSDHAAAINDVAILHASPVSKSTSQFRFQFASSGNDQQLKIFDVFLNLPNHDDNTQRMISSCLEDVYTPVADVASMGCFYQAKSKCLLVCGVGMDLWNIDLRCKEV